MDQLTIRQASVDDMAHLVPLFDAYRVFYGQESSPDMARSFLFERFRDQQSFIFIAFLDGDAQGFVQLYPSFSSVRCARLLILNDLFVAPGGRKKGVARGLLNAAARHGETLGAIRLTLITAKSNIEAQQLYDSAGWTRDEVFMTYNFTLPA